MGGCGNLPHPHFSYKLSPKFVGDIEEPVVYLRYQAYDYNEKLVTKGIPNAFIDSLTHDSIICRG